MLLRFRWFVVGVLSSLGVIGYLAKQLRKARARLTPGNLARRGMREMADILDGAADRVRPGGEPR